MYYWSLSPNLTAYIFVDFHHFLLLLLFFWQSLTCSLLLFCNACREGLANVQTLPSSREILGRCETLVVQGRKEIVSQGPSKRLGREPERLYPNPDPLFMNKANLCQSLQRCITVGLTTDATVQQTSFLLNCPHLPRRIFSMAITNSCATGRKMPHNFKQPILYTWQLARR